MGQKILVVDDEPAVTDLLVYNLRKANYEVLTAADGQAALDAVPRWQPDLILLDLMLPGVEGLEVCRQLRKTSDVPIIMLTALGEEIDRVVGLELGADDYVAKPFSVRELLARMKAVLRRAALPRAVQPEPTPAQPGSALPETFLSGPGGLRLEPDSRKVTVAETEVRLTQLEFDILHLLLSSAGRVLTRERLLEQAWGYDFAGDTRAVDSAIKRLRARLRAASPDADSIEAVRGVGYRLNRA
jgi:DNA-binding response OmpR family regulator